MSSSWKELVFWIEKSSLNMDVKNPGVIGVIQRWFRLIKKKVILGKVVWSTFNWILLPSPVVIVCNFNCVGLWSWYKAWGLLLALNLENTLIDYRKISSKVVRALVWSKYKTHKDYDVSFDIGFVVLVHIFSLKANSPNLKDSSMERDK